MRTATALLIVQTFYVVTPGQDPFFEVHLAPDAREETPRLKLLTRDDHLYADALDAEGSAQRFFATYHHARTDRGAISVLDVLEAV